MQVEVGIEKSLGFNDKTQIEAYGIDRFNSLCRKSTFTHIQDWEHFNDRLGYWLDMQDAFVTHTNEYIESVWWVLKTFLDRSLLYQSFKVAPYCPHCGISLSDPETGITFRDTDTPSIIVRLPLVDEPGVSLLVWTTSPWTLLGNAAVVVDPDMNYVTIRRGLPEGGSEQLILAHAAQEQILAGQSVSVVNTFKGRKLKGKRYKPLFTFLYSDKPISLSFRTLSHSKIALA
jgi:isoleucyl-tRNA synthetase